MIDFTSLLSAESRLRLERTEREISRLYALSDRWLAEALLKLARDTRKQHPDKLGNPLGETYNPAFVWHLVPEIAKRLGAKNLLPNEATCPEFSGISNEELRIATGAYLKNCTIYRMSIAENNDTPTPGEILDHEVANGNPVAFAVDRLASGPSKEEDQNDWIARHTREISRCRGHEETPRWSPHLQNKAS